MIQIEDWVIIALLFAFFFAGIIYLVYFIITRKLFSQEMDFQRGIGPNKAVTILSVEGVGIIKKIEMQVTDNDNSWIDMIIDGTSYSTFAITKTNNLVEENFNDQNQQLIRLEANLDARFHKYFSLFIHNRSDTSINSTGKIFYEIKKPLNVALKAIYSETKL